MDSEPEERPTWWKVKVTIIRDYEGLFYGTSDSAEEEAKHYFKRHDLDFDDEEISAESELEVSK